MAKIQCLMQVLFVFLCTFALVGLAFSAPPFKLSKNAVGRARKAQLPSTSLSSGLVGLSSDDDYYTRHLKLPAALEGFTEPGLMWVAAKADAQLLEITPEEYMNRVKTRMKKFVSEDVLYDRDVLLDSLRNELDDQGTFTLMLGVKSVGKSLILRSLVKEYKKAGGKVVLVNMRLTGHLGLTASIVKAIEALDPAFIRDFFEALRPTLVALVSKALPDFSKPIDEGSRAVLDLALKKVTPEEVIVAFAATAKKNGNAAYIIVDEANIAFSEKSTESKDSVQRVLQLFTALTKETRSLSVLLASSEYTYPYRLKKELGFNLANIGETVFAGEVPPGRMRELLVDKWGLGPGLSELCIGAYGGHIHYTYNALSKLSLQKQDFAAEDVGPPTVYSGIMECINAEAEHPGMIDLLRDVAVTGFAPIKEIDDPRADMMVKKDVAGFVKNGSLVVGLPRSVWVCGAKFGLIPASQQVRLMIGEVLSREGLLVIV